MLDGLGSFHALVTTQRLSSFALLTLIATAGCQPPVVQAHIHLGPAGQNGPVTAFLFGPVPAGGGRVNGEIARGTITASDLIGPLAGMTLDDLLAEMVAGNAYVNVHTNDGVAPTNTGPGDFPGGEVRGQIR